MVRRHRRDFRKPPPAGILVPVTTKDLEIEALKLPPVQRARLVRSLLASLNDVTDAEVEALWLEEAERRNAEADRDPSVEMPVDQSLREAREQLG